MNTAFSKSELLEMAKAVPQWWHSIDLGQGVVTDGMQSADFLANRVRSLQLPDLHGKHVLDIGAYDGFYSFEAERRGAARVVALDHYVWSLDLPEHLKYWKACKEQGIVPEPYHQTRHWRPDELPGKFGFDTAHRALSSKVEAIVGDFLTVDIDEIGRFDVVFFMGVLYHMENPLEAMRRVAGFTKQLAIIETAAVRLPGYEHSSLCEFYESNELNNDVSNWWAPSEPALEGLCRAAGFSSVKTLIKPPLQPAFVKLKAAAKFMQAEFPVPSLGGYRLDPQRYRTVAHATK